MANYHQYIKVRNWHRTNHWKLQMGEMKLYTYPTAYRGYYPSYYGRPIRYKSWINYYKTYQRRFYNPRTGRTATYYRY